MHTDRSRFFRSALSALLALALLALPACVAASSKSERQARRPSVRRLRFYNDTDKPTQPDAGGKHVVVWHGMTTSEPPQNSQSKVGVHTAPVPAHRSATLVLLEKPNLSSLAVKYRFQIAGYASVTDWEPIPDASTGNYIDSVTLRVLEGADDGLILTTYVRYWSASDGVFLTGGREEILKRLPDGP